MNFVIDENINYCPKCGTKFDTSDNFQIQDFNAGCSHSCYMCGAQWQKAPYEEIKKLACKHGDSGDYWI